jgi:hypothetical protein
LKPTAAFASRPSSAGRARRDAVERRDHLEVFQARQRFEHGTGFGHEPDMTFHFNDGVAQVEAAATMGP